MISLSYPLPIISKAKWVFPLSWLMIPDPAGRKSSCRCSFKHLQNSLRDGEFFHGLTRRHSSCSYSTTECVEIQSSRKTVSLYGQGTVACKYGWEHPISLDKLWRNDAHLQRVRPPGLQDKDRAHCLCAELQARCLITMMVWAGMTRPAVEMYAWVLLRSANVSY